MPTFRRGDFEFEIDDAWWSAANMAGFAPTETSFQAGKPEREGMEHLPVLTIPIDHIEATRRSLSHGVFNNGERQAKDRVLDILRGFRRGDQLPPIEVVRLPDGSSCSHRLHHGAHRFYCAVAAGYSHVPAVEVRGGFGDR